MRMRPSTWLLCGLALLAGVGIGASWDAGWARRVEARGLTPAEADQLYRDLRSDGRPLVEGGRFLAKVVKLTTPSVVHIQSQHKRDSRGGTVDETGSGVVMTSPRLPGYFVVTNRHVVADAPLSQISIGLWDGRTISPVRFWSDKATDIAVLQVDAAGLQPARWGNSDELEIGNLVLAMGSPFGLSHSVTWGIISAKGRRSLRLGNKSEVFNQDFLQTDAAINPGNSGGPLIDLRGEVVGINTAIASNSGGNDGIGFSIPSNLAASVVDQLLANGRVRRAYLGVKLDPHFNLETARRLKLDRASGARVVEVYPDTPAARARLQVDDVVLKFGEVEVQDENHLINLVSLTPPHGRPVSLTVFRDGRRIVIPVVLSDRAELDERSEAPAPPAAGTPLRFMGLTVHRLDGDIAWQLGLDPAAGGLLVLQVDRAGPLSGDIRLYDLIEEVAGRPVRTEADLGEVLNRAGSVDSLVLQVLRRTHGRHERLLVVCRLSR